MATFNFHYLPSSGTIDMADLRYGYQQGINTGYRAAGSMPSTLREFAPFYSVVTTGTVTLRSFLGKQIVKSVSGGIEL